MAYRSRRAPARRPSRARSSYSASRGTRRRAPARRSTRARAGSGRRTGGQTIRLVIQSAPGQTVAGGDGTAVPKSIGRARF